MSDQLHSSTQRSSAAEPSTTASSGADWAYQAPRRSASHPDQCYYRSTDCNHIDIADAGPGTPELTVLRFARSLSTKLRVSMPTAEFSFELDRATVRALHAALGDVLVDMEAAAQELDRIESFDRIQEELRDADEIGGARAYYAHPDVHYVPADQVAEKAAELKAAGAARYIVLPEPTIAADGEVSA